MLQVFGQDTDENEKPAFNPLTDKEVVIRQTNTKKIQCTKKDKYPYKDWVLQEKERKQPYLSRIKEITNIYSLMIDTDESNSDAMHEALASINFSYGKGRLAMPYSAKQNKSTPTDTSAEDKGEEKDIPQSSVNE